MNTQTMMITYLPIFLILFILGVLMPKLMRKEIFFGVSIPEDKVNDLKLMDIKKLYLKKYSLICGGFLIVLMAVLFYSKSPIIATIGVFIYIVLQMLVYLSIHKKVKEYKVESNWEEGRREVVVVDTSFRNEKDKKLLVSKAWFLVPLVIIILNVIIGFKTYPNLPDTIPMHWNAAGEVDRWATKSYKVILLMPITQLFMMIIMYISYKIIEMAKVQINASNPVVSREQNRRFRYIWSGYIIFTASIITITFTLINLNVLNILKWTQKQMLIIPIILAIFLMGVTVTIAVITGQGGSRIKITGENKEDDYINRKDDKYWKWGMFYVNKNDPAIIVEKRFGIGWTINFGNARGVVFFMMLIALIIIFEIVISTLS